MFLDCWKALHSSWYLVLFHLRFSWCICCRCHVRFSFHQGFDLGLDLKRGMLSAAAWRRVSRMRFAACSSPVSEDGWRCCCFWSRALGDRLLREELNSVQSAFLKLNCWQIGWITVCSRGVVVRSKQITSWSDPVVASSSTAQLVMHSVVVGVAKGRSRMEVPVPFL